MQIQIIFSLPVFLYEVWNGYKLEGRFFWFFNANDFKETKSAKKNFISIHQIFGVLKPNEYPKDCDCLACQL